MVNSGNRKSHWKRFRTFYIISFFVLLYAVIRLTGIFSIYKNTSGANEPTIKINSFSFVSNLKKPQIGNFIAFHYKDSMFGESLYIKRLVANENDVLEIKKGVVYNNGKNIDSLLELKYLYKIDIVRKREIEDFITHEFDLKMISNDSFLANLPKSKAKEIKAENMRYILPQDSIDTYLQYKNGFPCNVDYFGPVKIPKGCYFVMGDNRYNSQDSRYIGFIPHKSFRGTVLFK